MRSPDRHCASSPHDDISLHHMSTRVSPTWHREFRLRRWLSGRSRVMEISTFMMVRGPFLCDFLRSWTDGTDRVAVVCHVMRHFLVSLVDGFNLPMAIIPSTSNCSVASCPVDLNPGCPQQLVGPLDPTGNLVGCKSACVANLDNPGACLSPQLLTPSICSSVCPPIPRHRSPTHIEYQSDVWAFGAQYSRLDQLLHRLAQHRDYVPGLGRTVLLLL